MTPAPRFSSTACTRRILAMGAAGSLFLSMHAGAQGLRNLSGRVTDGHEPLQGAVVQLQDPTSNSIVTYLSDPDGSYHFKRLNGSTDFNVWANYHGHRSAVHAISKFDSHMDKVINLTIKMY